MTERSCIEIWNRRIYSWQNATWWSLEILELPKSSRILNRRLRLSSAHLTIYHLRLLRTSLIRLSLMCGHSECCFMKCVHWCHLSTQPVCINWRKELSQGNMKRSQLISRQDLIPWSDHAWSRTRLVAQLSTRSWKIPSSARVLVAISTMMISVMNSRTLWCIIKMCSLSSRSCKHRPLHNSSKQQLRKTKRTNEEKKSERDSRRHKSRYWWTSENRKKKRRKRPRKWCRRCVSNNTNRPLPI